MGKKTDHAQILPLFLASFAQKTETVQADVQELPNGVGFHSLERERERELESPELATSSVSMSEANATPSKG